MPLSEARRAAVRKPCASCGGPKGPGKSRRLCDDCRAGLESAGGSQRAHYARRRADVIRRAADSKRARRVPRYCECGRRLEAGRKSRCAHCAATAVDPANRRRPCSRCGGAKPAGRCRRYCDVCAAIARAEYEAAHLRRRALERCYEAEPVDRRVVLVLTLGLCGLCGLRVDPAAFHVDHVVPLARGGAHTYENCQAAHPRCNLSKGAQIAA